MSRTHTGENHAVATKLLGAARHLNRWFEIIYDSPRIVPDELCKEAVFCVKNAAGLARSAGVILKPKCHAWFEMSFNMRRTGNVSKFATYADETVNCIVSRVAQSVHPAHFALAILKKYFVLRRAQGRPW